MKKILLIISCLLLLASCNRIKCEGSVKGSEELYYLEVVTYSSNISGYGSRPDKTECQTRNKTQERINEVKRIEAKLKQTIKKEKRIECYNAGKDYDITFDLIKNYDLNCKQIEYINDHFILSSTKKDAGNLEGYYSGLFSTGHIKGNFYDWVNTENLATGKLIKHTIYHLDCNEERDTKKLEYYTEQDFIMYYVERCI